MCIFLFYLSSSRLEYFDEAVRDPASQTAMPVDIHQPPAFLHKILQLSAVQLLYDGTGTEQVHTKGFLLMLSLCIYLLFFFFFFLCLFLSDIDSFLNVISLYIHLLVGSWKTKKTNKSKYNH